MAKWARTSRSGEKEIETLRPGLDLGATLIDTAEMNGEGSAEKLVGKAMEGRRDTVFLVDKVLPQNASRRGMVQAYDGSLRRLGTDRIDLYLLHWRGTIPLHETLEAFTTLQRDGKILAGRRKSSSIPFIHSTPLASMIYDLSDRPNNEVRKVVGRFPPKSVDCSQVYFNNETRSREG